MFQGATNGTFSGYNKNNCKNQHNTIDMFENALYNIKEHMVVLRRTMVNSNK